MKILFIHNTYKQAGGEDVAVQLEMDILKLNGHEAELIEFNNNDITGLISKVKNGIQSFYNPTSFKIVNQKIKAYQPDIIHVHNLFFQASPSVLYAAKKNKVPVVMTLHNYRLLCANALLLRDNKPCTKCIQHNFPIYGTTNSCYRNSAVESALVTGVTGYHKISGTWKNSVTKYILLTNFARDLFLGSSVGLHKQQIVVKPNFVNDNGLGNSIREDFYLYAGRLSVEKGVILLLEAFAKMPQFRLVLAGDGPLKETLMQTYELNKNIEFAGSQKRAQLMLLMQKTKALIFPSIWYEGLPYTIIESLAAGTPVLCSRIGAMNEIITNQYNGLHFEPDSSQGIIDTVLTFDRSENQHLYQNARATYLEKYHPTIHYNSIISLYSSIINAPK